MERLGTSRDIMTYTPGSPDAGGATGIRRLGNKLYELTDHQGSVRALITDRKNVSGSINTPDLVGVSDYYAYGLVRPYRKAVNTTSAAGYRFGYHGMATMEHMNVYGTPFRLYDARTGRWMSVDPVTRPSRSPYHAFGLNPLSFIDPLGLTETTTATPDPMGNNVDPIDSLGPVTVPALDVRAQGPYWMEVRNIFGIHIRKRVNVTTAAHG